MRLREDVIDNCKVVLFPFVEGFWKNVNFDHTFFLNSHNGIRIDEDILKYRYLNSHNNEHHFHTKAHYRYVLPKVCELLGIDYNPYDFYIIEDIEDDGDFSFIVPKRKCKFRITYNRETVINENKDFVWERNNVIDDVSYNEMVSCREVLNSDFIKDFTTIGMDDNYHKMFISSHNCSIIENKTCGNGKTLLISGDSHSAIIAPVLCYYYSKVYYFDNRKCAYYYYDMVGEDNIDDALFMMWDNHPEKFYTECNLL